MDQQIVRGQQTPPDQQTNVGQKATFDQQKSIPEDLTISDKQTAIAQQKILEQEPKSDQDIFPDQQITPEGNEAYLRQHQRHLRSSYPSCDLSEVSYHTEQTGFAGSRHSSINTEPLTLDADQIHEAKDQAVDVMQRVDTDTALEIFTKDLEVKSNQAPEPGAELFADHLNTLVEKAQQVVEANEQQQSQLVNKTPGAPPASLMAETNSQENLAASLEDDVKLKND